MEAIRRALVIGLVLISRTAIEPDSFRRVHLILSYHILPYYILSYLIIFCLILSYHILFYHIYMLNGNTVMLTPYVIVGEQTQTMDNLLKCLILPQECTTEDFMEYNKLRRSVSYSG